LIATIAQSKKVARYVDMPLQHIHQEMLQHMSRETSRQHIEDLLTKMRAGIPGLAIRTTFITGFPGETDEHFESLLEFIERIRFERLGVFKYSQEEGSRAAKMDGQISASVKNKRHARAMKLQQKIARELAEAQKGQTLRVLVEQPQIARSEHDAPEVDCRVLLESPAPVGQFAEVQITGSQVYDLVATPL
ncbi:MAG: radical SAM protein, partial [Chthoniobacterales bacterium]